MTFYVIILSLYYLNNLTFCLSSGSFHVRLITFSHYFDILSHNYNFHLIIFYFLSPKKTFLSHNLDVLSPNFDFFVIIKIFNLILFTLSQKLDYLSEIFI